MVKGCFTNAGQFQVVIGTDVGDYYSVLMHLTGSHNQNKDAVKVAARKNMSAFERAISHFAEIFFPLLPALISGGLILGFRNIIGDIPVSNGKTLAQISLSGKHCMTCSGCRAKLSSCSCLLPCAGQRLKRWEARKYWVLC